jgi:hypothetical protein
MSTGKKEPLNEKENTSREEGQRRLISMLCLRSA